MCGVFGIIGHSQAKNFIHLALMALQHRGHDAAGIAGLIENEPRCIETVKGVGKVREVINEESLKKFSGSCFIGHTRYSTRNDSTSTREIHPHWAQSLQGRIAIVTNGDMVNTREQIDFMKSMNIKLYTSNDAEIIAAIINYQKRYKNLSAPQAVKKAMKYVKGGYAGMIMLEDDDRLIAFRDPWGIRPLYIAEFEVGGEKGVGFSSETCAFDIIKRFSNAHYSDEDIKFSYREVTPGEVISASPDSSLESLQFENSLKKRIGCVFETIYFSRPDSFQSGKSFQFLREQMGAKLYEEAPIEADLVTPVPKGGIPSAVGFANASGIPYSIGILEEPITGGTRSFISNESQRKGLAAMKYSILPDVVAGKRIVVVDDSIVRGTTMKFLVKALYKAGAQEVHLRIPCPPYNHACHYGIETKDPTTLISYKKSIEEIAQEVAATTLAYLSIPGLYQAIGLPEENFCDECLSGYSPIQNTESFALKNQENPQKDIIA